eukprot:s1608_g13.t1
MPATTEEYRKVLKVGMYAWLAMAAKYKLKHWLHGLTADPFLKFTEYILGDRVFGIQIPTSDGSQQRIKPDWAIVLSYEQKLRKEAMKLVMEGHTLAASLVAVTKDADLKEAYFTTPAALKYAASDSQPNKWQRFNSKGGTSSFSGKSFNSSSKGKGKGKGKAKSSSNPDPRFKGLGRELCFAWNSGDCDGSCGRVHQCRVKGCYGDHKAVEHKQKQGTKAWPRGFPWLSNADKRKVSEANFFVEQCINACICAVEADGFFLLEHPEDLGLVEGEHPGSIWQWPEVLDLIAKCAAQCFAIHQCKFGALTSKPTRLMTNMLVKDSRCHFGLPKFDKLGVYKGPLPRKCGHKHTHKLIGKTGQKWNTSPSAAYPPQMCEFIATLILNFCGRGSESQCCSSRGIKRVSSASLRDRDSAKSRRVELKSSAEQSNVASSGVTGKADAGQVSNGSDNAEFGLVSNSSADATTVAGQVSSGDQLIVVSDEEQGQATKESDDQFDLKACCNAGTPIQVEWDQESPFSESSLNKLREKWFSLLSDKTDAAVLDEGQPFYLRALAQWLKVFGDPDVHWLVDEEDSFAAGVYVGVGKPLPRSPQVFPRKLRQRKLDETEFNPLAENYPSAQLSSKELEEKFREEEQLGRMHPSRLGVLRQEFGDRLRVASMAAITKPDGSVRPLHDATHSVMVNHEIVYQDQIMCPGPPEIASVVREARETGEAAFCVSADIKAAHRLVKISCKADSSS